MTLTPGSRLGPYEIVAPLGAGGMGEVWKGRDTRLGRDVAIKILPAGFAQNEQFRARFEREAKTISSLNHPNICTLFDVGHENDAHYLVMELIEGESLADRLTRGPLPLDQVLRYGSQIADALDRAHKQGIVHRDLKPGNVMLTKTGAKLLDFGLARSGAESAPVKGMTEMPTQAKPLTQEGTLLGTFQYMAPEQLEGTEADARTDIFALGALLYEMATAKRAFEGSSRTSLIAAIVTAHPAPISSVAPMTPPALEHIVRKCLEKDPEDRWQSAHDVASELRWLSEAGSQAGVATTITVRRRTRERLAWGLAGLLGLSAVALAAFLVLRTAREETRPFYASVEPGNKDDGVPLVAGPIALSPDGTRLAMLVSNTNEPQLAVYDFSTGRKTSLENTTGAGFQFWSPDSKWIGFFSNEKLRKVEATGGAVQTLADAHEGRGGAWSPDGVIVFAPDIRGPLMKVAENGGSATPVTKPASEDLTHRNPLFLPDGKRFLFIERSSRTEPVGRLMAGSIDGGATRQILDRASNVQFAEGRLLFVRDGNLLTQRFNAKSLELEGAIAPVAENVDYFNPRDIGDFSASQNGLLAFRHPANVERSLVWIDRDGRLIDTIVPAGKFAIQSVSRDRSKVALSMESNEKSYDIWIADPTTKQLRRATFTNSPYEVGAAISADGQQLAVTILNAGASGGGWAASALWIQPVTGSRPDKSLLDATDFTVSDWSPDGKTLLGTAQRTGTGFDITYVSLDAAKPEVKDLVKTKFTENDTSFSPDGRWVAYVSDESGRNEVYVTDFPGAKGKWQVSRDGGAGPCWSADGTEIFYFQPPDTTMAVPVHLRDTIEIGAPVRLGMPDPRRFSPRASDGKRFLVSQLSPSTRDEPVHLIRNWIATLPK